MLPIQKSVTYVGNKGMSKAKIEKHERFKRFRVKSCRSISLPVKNMASGAPRGHITTGIFSTDKVGSFITSGSGYLGLGSQNLGWKEIQSELIYFWVDIGLMISIFYFYLKVN